MPPRRRPWQVFRKRLVFDDRSTRSYLREREAVEAAIAWCREQGPFSGAIAYVHNKDDARAVVGDGSNEVLGSASYVVSFAKDSDRLMLGTWAPKTPDEKAAYLRAAISNAMADGEQGRLSGGPTWRPVEEIIGRPL